MALVEFLMKTLDGLKGTDIVHFDVRENPRLRII